MTLNHGFTTASQALLERFIRTAQHHPRRLTAAIAALFLCGTGGAFAVASLGPDPADLPVQTVQHPVQSLADGQTLAALTDSLAPFALYRSDQVRSSDTAESLLQRLGVADPAAAAFFAQ